MTEIDNIKDSCTLCGCACTNSPGRGRNLIDPETQVLVRKERSIKRCVTRLLLNAGFGIEEAKVFINIEKDIPRKD